MIIIMLTRAGDQTLSLYLDGQGIDEHLGVASEKDVFAYETDHLGSVLNTDPAGSLRGYGAFGETIGFGPWITKHSDPVMYGFAGRAYDAESDLYYNRARMYDPTTGRFITLDPIGFAGRDANLYRYVRNNPLRWTDPSGLWAVVIGVGFSGVFGGGTEGSGGLVIGTNDFGQIEAGLFFSGGGGFGANVAVDAFVGYYPGNISSVGGQSVNYNVGAGYVTGSLFTDPATGSAIGGTFGLGYSFPPLGGGISTTNTGLLTRPAPACR